MFEVLWNRNLAAKTWRNIVPQGLSSLNCMSALENAVYLLNREDIPLGKISRKSEKNILPSRKSNILWIYVHGLQCSPGKFYLQKATCFVFQPRSLHILILHFCFLSFLLLHVTAPQFPTVGLGCHTLQDFTDSENYMLITKYFSASSSCWNYRDYSDPQEASVLLPKKHLTYCKCTLCLFWKWNMDISGISKLHSVSA